MSIVIHPLLLITVAELFIKEVNQSSLPVLVSKMLLLLLIQFICENFQELPYVTPIQVCLSRRMFGSCGRMLFYHFDSLSFQRPNTVEAPKNFCRQKSLHIECIFICVFMCKTYIHWRILHSSACVLIDRAKQR